MNYQFMMASVRPIDWESPRTQAVIARHRNLKAQKSAMQAWAFCVQSEMATELSLELCWALEVA